MSENVFRMRTKYTAPASPSLCLSHHTPHSRNIFVAASFPVSLTSSQPREYPEISSMTSWSQWNKMLPDGAGRWESRQCLGVTVCVCCNQSSSSSPFFLLYSFQVLQSQSRSCSLALSGNLKWRRAIYPLQSLGFFPPIDKKGIYCRV